jgi:hypothetical protein
MFADISALKCGKCQGFAAIGSDSDGEWYVTCPTCKWATPLLLVQLGRTLGLIEPEGPFDIRNN